MHLATSGKARRPLGLMVIVLVSALLPGNALADSEAPAAPTAVVVAEGSAWQSTPQFNISWSNPVAQDTPIAIAHYELCPLSPVGPCTTNKAAGEGISKVVVTVPTVGSFRLRIWLEDAAGNVNAGTKSSPVILRFDNEIPPHAEMRPLEEWLNAIEGFSPTVVFELPWGSSWPLSGIWGYSVTTNGSSPDAVVDAVALQDNDRFPANLALNGLPEGATQLRVRSISNTGVASADVASGILRVDRTVPELLVTGIPQGDAWYSRSVAVGLQGIDQEGLSGMSGAPMDRPIDDGGYLDYVVNGVAHKVRGDRATLDFVLDGRHEIVARAIDAAGNASARKTTSFKVDRTPPVGSFRAPNPSDPRQLIVDVRDATSGVEGGHIEYRRMGDATFRRLPTAFVPGQLRTRIDDLALAKGSYEYRALVRDVAGNTSVVTTRADGKPMTLAMPLRRPTRLSVATAPRKICKRVAVRRWRGLVRSRRLCRTRPGSTSAWLGHGRRLGTQGRLTTVGGAPIRHSVVRIEGRARSGGRFTVLGKARTDTQGRFFFSVPAGPSRTVRYRYEGTNTALPATGSVSTKVAAGVRMGVDRRVVRNGQAVLFSGRLLGKPIPKAGKIVALQARVGRKWRTFATPRAKKSGVFKHRYRFTATTGVRRYAFRALVAREGAYPYERGISRTVRVLVRGR